MRRSWLLAPCIGLNLLACSSEVGSMKAGGSGSPGQPPSCKVDDECVEEPESRACRDGRCTNVCPAGMTYVGAGVFTAGCDAKENSGMMVNCARNAQPAHEVTLSAGFCISKTELSVGEYRACVTSGRCPGPGDLACTARSATWTEKPGDNEMLPMNCLLWTEARAACAAQGKRLPTEAEWEKAARGVDGRRYPWGGATPTECGKGVNWGGGSDCSLAPWPVGTGKGSQALSAAFALDMAGNLWEWVEDWYAADAYEACRGGCTDPRGPAEGVVRVRRGGSYKSPSAVELRTSFREFHFPTAARSDMLGVRCAMDAPAP